MTEPLSKIRSNFPATGHRLLNLTIEVGAWGIHPKRQVEQNGIAIQGAGTEVRDSTTSDAHAGIYLFGPNRRTDQTARGGQQHHPQQRHRG